MRILPDLKHWSFSSGNDKNDNITYSILRKSMYSDNLAFCLFENTSKDANILRIQKTVLEKQRCRRKTVKQSEKIIPVDNNLPEQHHTNQIDTTFARLQSTYLTSKQKDTVVVNVQSIATELIQGTIFGGNHLTVHQGQVNIIVNKATQHLVFRLCADFVQFLRLMINVIVDR